MATQQLNFTNEEIQVLREIAAERIEAKRSAAVTAAAEEELRLRKEEEHKQGCERHLEDLANSPMMEAVRKSHEALRKVSPWG